MFRKVIQGIAFLSLFYPFSVNGQPVAQTRNGKVRGTSESFQGSEIYIFRGIPYAKPPTGTRRFMKPEESDKWTGELNATKFGDSCLQGSFFGHPPGKVYQMELGPTSENCLYLNILVKGSTFKGQSSNKKPVMFWIHGGGYQLGSGIDQAKGGLPLVALEDIILVTINYRLGAMGFIYADGIAPNLGLWDQNLALKWIKANIAQFGGDPNRITIFGESAGSMSVSAHIMSPISKGLFNNAIMQSGSFLELNPFMLKGKSTKVLETIGCTQKNALQCLNKNIEKLTGNTTNWIGVWPVYGDAFIPKPLEDLIADRSIAPINLLLGTEKDDGSIFYQMLFPDQQNANYEEVLTLLSGLISGASKEQLEEMYFKRVNKNKTEELRSAMMMAEADRGLTCPTYVFGYRFAKYQKSAHKIYAYYHTHKPKKSMIFACNSQSQLGVCHMDELPFVFGLPIASKEDYTEKDIKMSKNMMNIWATFARDGKPPEQGSTDWPNLATHGMNAFNLNTKDPNLIERKRLKFCQDNWEIFEQSIKALQLR